MARDASSARSDGEANGRESSEDRSTRPNSRTGRWPCWTTATGAFRSSTRTAIFSTNGQPLPGSFGGWRSRTTTGSSRAGTWPRRQRVHTLAPCTSSLRTGGWSGRSEHARPSGGSASVRSPASRWPRPARCCVRSRPDPTARTSSTWRLAGNGIRRSARQYTCRLIGRTLRLEGEAFRRPRSGTTSRCG